jgi:outer membrane receptor protein involved in Fe transport
VVIPKVYDGRNTTFFFFAYEGLEIRQGAAFVTTVPTAAESSSGFTNFADAIAGQPGSTPADLLGRTFSTGQIFDPATTRPVTSGQVDPVTGLMATGTGYVRDPLAGNLLPANRLDSNAIKLLNLYPAPNLPGLLNNFAGNPVGYTNGPAFDPRLDQIFSDHDQAFVSFSYNGLNSFAPPPFPGIAIGGNTFNCLRVFQGDMGALGETHSFSPNIINSFEVGFTYLRNSYIPTDANTLGIPAQFGIQGIPQTPQDGGLPYLNIAGLNFLGVSGVLPTYKNSNVWDIRENLTKIQGRHVLKMGFETQYNFFPFLIGPSVRGNFTYAGSYTSIPGNNVAVVGPGTAQFLLTPEAATVANGIDDVGGANKVGGSDAVQTVEIRHYSAGYFQDDWKTTRKLSLNLGIRWDYFSPTTNRFDAETNFVPGAASEWLFHTSRQNNPAVSAGFTQTMQTDGIKVVYAGNVDGSTPKDDFAPRVGLAYQITPSLVVRAGYGIFYNDFEASSGGDHLPSDNYPFLFNYSFSAPDPDHPITPNNSIGLLENGLLNFPLNAAASTGVGLSPIGRQLVHPTPYTQGVNLTFQYQLGAHQTVQLGYVGTFSRHLALTAGANWASVMLPPLANYVPYLPYPDLSPDFNYITNNGDSSYHSLQFTYERRFSTGLSVLANYTYSKCISDAQDQLNGTLISYRAPFVPGFGIQGDYALCEYDVRNLVHLSGIYPLPFGKGQRFLGQARGLTNAVVGGWTTNWILTLEDGFPISIPCTITTTAQFGCAADLVPGQNPIGGPHNVNQWLNPAAFTNPPIATSIGQSSLAPLGGSLTPVAGPGFHRLDFSLFKQFRTSERTNLEFRADVFNLTNTPNFSDTNPNIGSMNTNFNSPAFGQITATRDNPNDPREIQLALKFYW